MSAPTIRRTEVQRINLSYSLATYQTTLRANDVFECSFCLPVYIYITFCESIHLSANEQQLNSPDQERGGEARTDTNSAALPDDQLENPEIGEGLTGYGHQAWGDGGGDDDFDTAAAYAAAMQQWDEYGTGPLPSDDGTAWLAVSAGDLCSIFAFLLFSSLLLLLLFALVLVLVLVPVLVLCTLALALTLALAVILCYCSYSHSHSLTDLLTPSKPNPEVCTRSEKSHLAHHSSFIVHHSSFIVHSSILSIFIHFFLASVTGTTSGWTTSREVRTSTPSGSTRTSPRLPYSWR